MTPLSSVFLTGVPGRRGAQQPGWHQSHQVIDGGLPPIRHPVPRAHRKCALSLLLVSLTYFLTAPSLWRRRAHAAVWQHQGAPSYRSVGLHVEKYHFRHCVLVLLCRASRAETSGGRQLSYWTGCAWPRRPTSGPPPSQAACAAVCRLPSHCWATPRSSSLTNPPQASTQLKSLHDQDGQTSDVDGMTGI